MPSVSGQAVSLTHLDVNEIIIDPNDSQSLYMTTFGRGLYFTYNINNGWQKADKLPSAIIRSIAINPKSKCNIYATVGNRLYGTVDCSRTWEQLYFDNNPEVQITSVVVDHYNPDNIYISTSRGEIIKSIDKGRFWRTIHRFSGGVNYLKMSPQDSRLLFVTTDKNEFFSFNSISETYPKGNAREEENFSITLLNNLSKVISDFKAGNIQEVNICLADGTIVLATERKILRSPDNGITWEDIKLIPSDDDASIRAVAINPNNAEEIYYVTRTTFYSSVNGGVSWNTRRLPTAKVGSSLVVNPDNPQIIYLGVRGEED